MALQETPPNCWGWQAALGLFAVCQALKFLWVPHLFVRYHSYAYLVRQPIPQEGWAAILLVYGVAALACALTRRTEPRGMVSVISIPLWLYLGGEMLMGSIVNNVWTSDGIFELCAGIGCLVSLFVRAPE